MPQNKTLSRDWPQARGVFCSNDHSFVVWVNAADHVQVTCLSSNGNLEGLFDKYTRGIMSMEKALMKTGERFSFDEQIGYIVSDPKHVGTTLKITVRARLPHLLNVSCLELSVFAEVFACLCSPTPKLFFITPHLTNRDF